MRLGEYKHYKGNTYRVIALGKHSDTLEEYVVYQGQYNSEEFGDKPIRVKPVTEFKKDMEIDGKTIKRFEFIKD
jgi:hypothetical protein